jgi:glucan endo-1,3-beta-D-glucosidase
MSNSISSGKELFYDALDQTKTAAGSTPVWVTETGWPVSGKTENLGVPSTTNAKKYWDAVGCQLFADGVNTFWYTLTDAAPTTPNPSFGIVISGSTTPLYDLSCDDV